MYPGTYAAQTPDRIAAVMAGTGETVSYGELSGTRSSWPTSCTKSGCGPAMRWHC